MSRSKNQKSIPHRYRKGKDGGKRKSQQWQDNKQTKRPMLKMPEEGDTIETTLRKINQHIGKNQQVYCDTHNNFYVKCVCGLFVNTREMWYDTKDKSQRHYKCLSEQRMKEIKAAKI